MYWLLIAEGRIRTVQCGTCFTLSWRLLVIGVLNDGMPLCTTFAASWAWHLLPTGFFRSITGSTDDHEGEAHLQRKQRRLCRCLESVYEEWRRILDGVLPHRYFEPFD